MLVFNKKILYVILGIFVLRNIAQRLTSQYSIVELLLTILVILIAITFHEFAHAFAADKLGDDTPREQGRLTLNPLKHIDPFGFVMLIVAGFGWGKPVQIQPKNFNRDISMTKGEAIVALAGPLTNLVLAIISSIIMALLVKFGGIAVASLRANSIIIVFLMELVGINVSLFVFNLIPLPPLDGSKILNHILPIKQREWFERNEHILQIVFAVMWITGLTGIIVTPCISFVEEQLMKLVGLICGINS